MALRSTNLIVDDMVAHIMAEYRAMTALYPTEWRAWAVWYQDVNADARRIVAESARRPFPVTLRQVADVHACFSRNSAWSDNGRKLGSYSRAIAAIDAYTMTGVVPHIPQTTGVVLDNARNVLINGATHVDNISPDGGAFKELNFSASIMLAEDALCADRWAARSATADDSWSTPSGADYTAIADAFKVAAKMVGLAPFELQAALWVYRTGQTAR